MIIAAFIACNLRFALALRACTATIRDVTLTRRHIIALITALFASKAHAQDVPLVFAAASLKTVLDEIAGEVPMRLNYAGSGVLARQITLGAPADLFISANPQWMGVVADAGLLKGASVPLLSNSLVLVGAEPNAKFDLMKLEGKGRIAMGFTNAVPAGQYAKAAFQSLSIWDAIQPQVVETENVRAAMALVSRGELPFAVVYNTDALADPNVHVLAEIPAEMHPQILYQAGVLKGSGAAGTLSALRHHPAFVRHGFIPL